MQIFKIYFNKIKNIFRNSIIRTILVSFLTVIVIITILGLVVYQYRGRIFNYIASNYIPQQQVLSVPNIKENEQAVDSAIKNLLSSEVKKPANVIDAVKKAKPAVVSIYITKLTPKFTVSYQDEKVVDQNGKEVPGVSLTTPVYTPDDSDVNKIGSGTGFIISKNGLIITNNHVVVQKDVNYKVLLNSGKEYDAKVIARDSILDIAFLKIEASNLPYLELSDSDKIDVGESVIAIGNSLGEFKNTVSVGVVSGLSRSVVADGSYGQTERLDKVIQTDAAINPGNSGGPLLNLDGKVIGINVAVVEGSSSVAFSLPINSLKDVINSVIKTGKIIRPYVGLRYVMLTPELKEKYSLPYDYGLWVQYGENADEPAVSPGSPADKVGIKEGDFITEINGIKIDTTNDFAVLIRNKKIGDLITLKVWSDGVVRVVVVKLEQVPDTFQ